MKMITDKILKKRIITLVKAYKEPITDLDILVLEGLYKIFNDAEFESKHPRKKDGKFAKKGEHEPSEAYIDILDKIKQSNDKNITPEDVIESAIKTYGLDKHEVYRQIRNADEYNKNIKKNNSFTNVVYKVNGKYTEEREQLHQDILKKIFLNKDKARPKDGAEPTVIFLGGRGGSGKSKFNGLVYDESNYIVLDADKIKEELKPDYKGFNAYEVHEESSEILKDALEKAKDEGLNIVLDATMKTLSSTEEKIKAFEQAGYNIEMYYMHLPREKAAERAIKRFAGDYNKFDGRYVPLDQILEKMKHNEENFDALKHYASKWAFYNNDVPSKDDKPILIDKNY